MSEATKAAEAPRPGTPEYEAAMVAKFENRDVVADKSVEEQGGGDKKADTPAPAQRPEWFPENLWKGDKSLEENSQALAASYAEARKAISSKKPEEKPAAPAVDAAKKALEDNLAALKAKADAKPEEVQAAEKALAEYKPAAPVAPAESLDDVSTKLSDILAENGGQMTEEGYKLAEKAGLSRSLVDSYVAGQMAIAREYERATYAEAGGEEQYKQMIAWAKTGMKPAEIKAFDTAITSGDEAAMKLAVQGLKAQFTAANGQAPQLLGGARPNGSTLAFRDRHEMKAAMADPRYKSSAAYRADVEARLAVTDTKSLP